LITISAGLPKTPVVKSTVKSEYLEVVAKYLRALFLIETRE
jgi:hypothetical protein